MNTSTGLKLRDCSALPSVFTPCRVCKRLSTPGWSLAEGSEPGLKPSLNNSGSLGWGMGSVGTLDQLHKDPQSNAEQKESRKPDSQSVKHPKRPVWTRSKWQLSLCWIRLWISWCVWSWQGVTHRHAPTRCVDHGPGAEAEAVAAGKTEVWRKRGQEAASGCSRKLKKKPTVVKTFKQS